MDRVASCAESNERKLLSIAVYSTADFAHDATHKTFVFGNTAENLKGVSLTHTNIQGESDRRFVIAIQSERTNVISYWQHEYAEIVGDYECDVYKPTKHTVMRCRGLQDYTLLVPIE